MRATSPVSLILIVCTGQTLFSESYTLSRRATQGIPIHSRNDNFHPIVYKIPPIDLILTQINFVLTRRNISLKYILILFSHFRFILPKSHTATIISYVAPISFTKCRSWHIHCPGTRFVSLDIMTPRLIRLTIYRIETAVGCIRIKGTVRLLQRRFTKRNNRSQWWSVGNGSDISRHRNKT